MIKENLKPLSFVDVDKEVYAKSLLGIYEKRDISLFRDLYMWAYKRSAKRYSAIQQGMEEPNLLKMKYRNAIQSIIRTIILEKVGGQFVVRRIKKWIKIQNLSDADKIELVRIVETEILSLHEGNIAQFRIRPSEFKIWKALQ